MPATDSIAYFKNFLVAKELYSEKRWKNLNDKGWNTLTKYASAWGYLEKSVNVSTENLYKVIAAIEGFKYDEPGTWPVNPATQRREQPIEPPWHIYRETMFDA